MQAFEMKIHIYADTQQEVDDCRKAIYQFIEDNRMEGRAVTAKKISEALPKWKSNPLVRAGIINFLNKQ